MVQVGVQDPHRSRYSGFADTGLTAEAYRKFIFNHI
jgi:hypothetical protein